MAFKLPNGRSPFLKTGRDIPPTMMSGSAMYQTKNPVTGEDLKKKAQAIADTKLQENITKKPLEGSTDVRKETGSATNIVQAKTPAEITAWKKSIGQPGAGRYNQTVTAEATAQGQDKEPVKGGMEIKIPEQKPIGQIPVPELEEEEMDQKKINKYLTKLETDYQWQKSWNERKKKINYNSGGGDNLNSLRGLKVGNMLNSVGKVFGGCKTCN